MLEEQRLSFQTFFKKLVFSDESQFCAGDTSRRAWMTQTTPVSLSKRAHPDKKMLWAAIGAEGLLCDHWCQFETYYKALPAHIVPPKGRKCGGLYYSDCILETWFAYVRADVPKRGELIYMDDGASCHTCKFTQGWWEMAEDTWGLQRLRGRELPGHGRESNYGTQIIPKWPGNSPDLNPIENFWTNPLLKHFFLEPFLSKFL